jgi:hypothetical protein
VIVNSQSGGSGNGMTGSGGPGGDVYFYANTVAGFAYEETRNTGSAANPGDGGTTQIYCYGPMVNVLIDSTADGGDGLNDGGAAPGLFVYNYGAWSSNIELVSLRTGGSASGNDADGATAGSVQFYAFTYPGIATVEDLTIDAVHTGGAAGPGTGAEGGIGGDVTVNANYATASFRGLRVLGSLTGGSATDGLGGSGGNLNLYVTNGALDAFVSMTLNGGSATTGQAGNGGPVDVETGSDGANVTLAGTLSSQGGGATGAAGDAGQGGSADVDAGFSGRVAFNNLALDFRGGNSASDEAGPGGSLDVEIESTLTITGNAVWNFSGGDSANGNGGNGGNIAVSVGSADLTVPNNWLVSGGQGSGTGNSGGTGGNVNVGLDEFGIGVGGILRFNAQVNVNGGNGTNNANGAFAGTIFAVASDPVDDGAGQLIVASTAVLSASGGNGNGTGDGGGGSFIQIAGVQSTTIAGDVLANGGTGVNGGDGGSANISAGAGGVITISGDVAANGGTGTTTGGVGGFVGLGTSFGEDEAECRVTGTGTVRANGAGATTTMAGTISIDIVGTGTTQLTQDTGAIVETRDGAGTLVPGNIMFT